MTWFLVKLGIRLVAFTGVFWFVTRLPKGYRAPEAAGADGEAGAKGAKGKPPTPTGKQPGIMIQPRWAVPVIGVLFAAMNFALYWLLQPLLDVATLRIMSMAMPFIVNGLLLWGTARVVRKKQWLRLDGIFPAVWLAGILTLAHGVLWVALDYIPGKV